MLIIGWMGLDIPKLHDLALVQAYKTCLAQEKRRDEASKHPKFNQGFEHPLTKRKVPAMELPPPNPIFMQVKSELVKELNKRNINVEI